MISSPIRHKQWILSSEDGTPATIGHAENKHRFAVVALAGFPYISVRSPDGKPFRLLPESIGLHWRTE
ncbi:MAG: hypothetical protein ABL912_01665 [Novosphingobium sp.]